MASWLKENERSIYGLILIGGGLVVFILAILLPPDRINKDVILMVLGALNTIISIIVGYHWGSSAGRSLMDATQSKLLLKEDKPCPEPPAPRPPSPPPA